MVAAYKLPETPCILVHPNAKAKSGKFDCSVTSLSMLLDYRVEDNKEGTFEGDNILPDSNCQDSNTVEARKLNMFGIRMVKCVWFMVQTLGNYNNSKLCLAYTV